MKLSGITAILTVCLVTSCTPQISNKNIKDSSKMQNIQKEITMEQVRNRCRSMLHKVENRDDLIKQMYDTAFKDDCLYAMYALELENIWKIPVVEGYDSNQLHRNFSSSIGLYVAIRHDSFQTSFIILPTKQYYKEKISIFPENKFPDFLPKPNEKEMPPKYGDYYPRQENDPIKELVNYYWRENGREMVAANNGSGAIQTFTFYSNTEMSPIGF